MRILTKHIPSSSSPNVSRETFSVEGGQLRNMPQQQCRATAGFTIAEVLLTVALVGLLTLAVATGIGVALNAYTDIRTASEAQSVLDNAVTSVSDELRFAYDIEAVTVGTVAYPSPNIPDSNGGGTTTAYAFNSSIRGYRLYVGNYSSENTTAARISLFAISAVPTASGSLAAFPTTIDTATPLPLVDTDAGAENATSDSRGNTTAFTAQLKQLTWDETTRLWTYEIEITDGTTTKTSGALTVRPVNNW